MQESWEKNQQKQKYTYDINWEKDKYMDTNLFAKNLSESIS